MRRILVVCILLAAIGFAPSSAAAKPESTFIFHFKGRAGSATLTDCPVGAPAGFVCRAVVVFAFEQRVNEDGQQLGGAGFNVTLFDVTILDSEPFFSVEEIGFGFTEDAAVKINGSLSKGAASAQDVQLCQFAPCAPGAPESISVSVDWAGFGPTTSFKAHDKFSDPFCFVNSRSRGSLRSASATGTVDGVSFVAPNLPGFGATLQKDSFGTVQRCSFI